jgi:hypothetical protein
MQRRAERPPFSLLKPVRLSTTTAARRGTRAFQVRPLRAADQKSVPPASVDDVDYRTDACADRRALGGLALRRADGATRNRACCGRARCQRLNCDQSYHYSQCTSHSASFRYRLSGLVPIGLASCVPGRCGREECRNVSAKRQRFERSPGATVGRSICECCSELVYNDKMKLVTFRPSSFAPWLCCSFLASYGGGRRLPRPGEFSQDGLVESGQIVRLAGRYEAVVHHDLLVYPVRAGVDEVELQ